MNREDGFGAAPPGGHEVNLEIRNNLTALGPEETLEQAVQ